MCIIRWHFHIDGMGFFFHRFLFLSCVLAYYNIHARAYTCEFMNHVRFPTAWFGEDIKNENGTYMCAAACFHLENNNIIIQPQNFYVSVYGPTGYTHIIYIYTAMYSSRAKTREAKPVLTGIWELFFFLFCIRRVIVYWKSICPDWHGTYTNCSAFKCVSRWYIF